MVARKQNERGRGQGGTMYIVSRDKVTPTVTYFL
jgi:hypothetical protein